MSLTESHDLDAEEMLVSAAFRAEGNLQREIVAAVSADQFYSDTCRQTWRMLLGCLGEEVDLRDPDAVITAAKTYGEGWRNMVRVTGRNPMASNWKHYRKTVEKHEGVRRLESVAILIQRQNRAALDTTEEYDATTEQIAAEAATELHAILTGRSSTTSVNQREALRIVMDDLQELERRHNAGELIAARTGVPALDGIFPLREDTIVTLVAPSGTGKSSLMAQIGLFTAGSGGHVTAFTHEMSCGAFEIRVIGQMEPIHEGRLMEGVITEKDWACIARGGTALRNLPLYIDECPANIDALEQGIRYAHAVRGCTWFLIDYAQLIEVSGPHARKLKHEQMEHIGNRLLALRRELKCGILLLAQTTNKPSGPQWTIADCDSGRGLKQPSNAMAIMYQSGDNKESVTIDLGKNRNGAQNEETVPFIAGRISDPSSRSLEDECKRRRDLLATYEHKNPEAPERDDSAKAQLVGKILRAIADENADFTYEQTREAAELLGVA